MAGTAWNYLIRIATASDVGAVWQLVFREPETFVRRLSRSEVEELADQGELYLVTRIGRPEELVGTAYVRAPREDGDEAEFGGAYIHPDHRGRGLFQLLVRVTLCAYRTMIDKPQPLIAHVAVDNPAPRAGLRAAGFDVRDCDIAYDPRLIGGLENMPMDSAGMVHADTFVCTDAGFLRALNYVVRQFDGFVRRDHEAVAVTIKLKSYTGGAMIELLQKLEAAA